MKAYYTGGYTVSENGSAFDRGVAAGEIAARLANHDAHFAAINGSIDRSASELRDLRLAVQRLTDATTGAAEAARATAQALKESDETRRVALQDAATQARSSSESRWQPLNRFSLIISGVVGIVGITAFILSIVH
jgi:hypothetical protein